MPLQLTTFPALNDATQTVTLGTSQFKIRTSWNTRDRSWIFGIFATDDTPLLQGIRIAAAFSPAFGAYIPGFTGMFQAIGSDDYTREALGSQLQLWWWSPQELAAIAPSTTSSSLSVTVV